MPVIAITGGVGAGKSSVAALFKELGATVLSADEAAREVLEPASPILSQVIREFGASFMQTDGSLDRKRLGDLVFSDSTARKRLESITHPHIRRLLKSRIDEALAQRPNGVVVAEVPLLYETQMESEYDAVIAVVASKETLFSRLKERNGLNQKEVEKRITSQLSMQEKATRSDYIIENDGNRDALRHSVLEIWDRIVMSG